MIRFTDPNLYVLGTCSMQFADTNTGDIVYWTDKVTDFNDVNSANELMIRAGLSNGIAAVLTTDSDKTVTATAGNFSLKAKMMQIGGTMQYNGIAPVCQVVTASGTSLTIDVTGGVPVAPYGYQNAICYVQEVSAESPIATFGTAYAITTGGDITGFTATSGKQYKVWYFTHKVSALEATVYSNFQPGVYHVTAQLAVYRNMSGAAANEGTQIGWLYAIYPRYRMTVGNGVNGSQTTADTTDLSGHPLPMDEVAISANCSDCENGVTAYYLYVPVDGTETIKGILPVIGGVIAVAASGSAQVQPMFIMENNTLVPTASQEGFSYELSSAPSGTSVSTTGLITAGDTAGSGTLTVSYDNGGETLSDTVTVTVVSQ